MIPRDEVAAKALRLARAGARRGRSGRQTWRPARYDRTSRMKREDYLADPSVRDFVNWLRRSSW